MKNISGGFNFSIIKLLDSFSNKLFSIVFQNFHSSIVFQISKYKTLDSFSVNLLNSQNSNTSIVFKNLSKFSDRFTTCRKPSKVLPKTIEQWKVKNTPDRSVCIYMALGRFHLSFYRSKSYIHTYIHFQSNKTKARYFS